MFKLRSPIVSTQGCKPVISFALALVAATMITQQIG